tara:strand:+ start:2304 stop:3569 length:1266 start_codon:yes stop_codon:yes gene_type:complete
MNFLVVTNAPTFYKNKKNSAYAPYVKEMDIWFSKVENFGIISPGSYPEKIFTKDFERQDLRFFKIPFLQFNNIFKIFAALIYSPYLLFVFITAFIWADHIHLRCPGNIGLIGCIVQIFFPKKPKSVKYAGNWDPKAKQPWSYRLQKKILNNPQLSKNIKVLVYGEWENQSENVIPFFTASFTENDKELVQKNFISPYKFIFVGTLNSGKRPIFAIKMIENLLKNQIPVKLEMYGEGVIKKEIIDYIKINNLEPFVQLMGNEVLENLKNVYKSAHFLILASKSEGWPKAIAEAMFFGCIPISTNVSCVPWMLGYPPPDSYGDQKGGAMNVRITNRGILIPDDEFNKDEAGENSQYFREKTVESLIELIRDTDKLKKMSSEAQKWSQQYTLERFDEAIKDILASNYDINKKSSSFFGRGGGVG